MPRPPTPVAWIIVFFLNFNGNTLVNSCLAPLLIIPFPKCPLAFLFFFNTPCRPPPTAAPTPARPGSGSSRMIRASPTPTYCRFPNPAAPGSNPCPPGCVWQGWSEVSEPVTPTRPGFGSSRMIRASPLHPLQIPKPQDPTHAPQGVHGEADPRFLTLGIL